jgi:pyruvate,orthophosphate dikinase
MQGGITSLAASSARSWGKAVVVDLPGTQVDWEGHTLTCIHDTGKVLHLGDTVTIDGSTGWVYLGQKPITLANQDPNFDTVMGWADKYRRLRVVATAGSADDVTAAKRLSAESIGLFRAENFLLQEGRADLFLRFILAENDAERAQWLVHLLPLLQQDFAALYQQLGNCELSVMLPDSALHEYLPRLSSPTFEQDLTHVAERLQLPYEQCSRRLRELHTTNPLLGFRGCRLCIVFPEITEVFTKAIIGAALEISRSNFPQLPTIVLPLSFSDQEVDRVASLVTTVSDSMCARAWSEASSAVQRLPVPIAVLVETPRACYKADFIGSLKNVTDLIVNTDALTDLVFGMHAECAGPFLVCYSCQMYYLNHFALSLSMAFTAGTTFPLLTISPSVHSQATWATTWSRTTPSRSWTSWESAAW